MKHRILLAPLAVAALVVTGCSTETEPPEDTEQAIALPVDASRVIVVDAGDLSNGQVLAYSLADAPTVTRTVEIGSGFSQQVVRADAVDPTAPGLVADLDSVVLPLTVSGQEGASTLTLDGEAAAGFTVTERLSTTGQVSTVEFAAPVDATDDARALAEEAIMKVLAMPVIFPAEPIGPGAVWSVDSRVTGEATLLQTTTYTLSSLADGRAQLAVRVEQRPAQGALTLDNFDTGEQTISVTLDVLNTNTTTAEGELTVDLQASVPAAGTVAWTTRVVYGSADSDINVVQDESTRLSFR